MKSDPTPTGRPRRRLMAPVVAVALVLVCGAGEALARESVGDRVWNDLNNNGRLDAGEPGIAGVTVISELDLNHDCVPDPPNPLYPNRSVVTSASGTYFFVAIGAGSYIIALDESNFVGAGPLFEYTSSTGSPLTTGPFEPGIPESNSGADDGKDHGTVAQGRISSCPVTLTPGGEPVGEAPTEGFPFLAPPLGPDPDNNLQMTIDFGLFKLPPGSPGVPATKSSPPPPVPGSPGKTPAGAVPGSWTLGDFVWSDLDRDGRQDRGEPGIANVVVRLLDAAGASVGETTTDARGKYALNGFAPGTYRIGFVSPPGSRPTLKGRGPRRGLDSDISRNARTGLINVQVGQREAKIDAGFIVTPAIGGYAWRDTDGDGQKDAGEEGVRRVRVTLETVAGRRVAQVFTTRSGKYLFLPVQPGRYRVRFAPVPSGASFTTANVGADATDSDVNPRTGLTKRLRIGRGTQILTLGAGLR